MKTTIIFFLILFILSFVFLFVIINLSFTQLASPSWFYEDPFFAWAFFGQFQKALFDENKIVECHGRISHF